MFKKEMSIKEFIEQPEIKTLIDKGMMTVNAVSYTHLTLPTN